MNRFNAVGAKLTQPALGAFNGIDLAKASRGLLTALQHTFTVVGLSAVAVLTVLFLRPDLAKEASHLLNPEPELRVQAPPLSELLEGPQVVAADADVPAELTAEDRALLGTRKQQQYVTNWLARRYRVANDATNMLVSTAYMTAREIKLDPLLILAVMAIESSLNPFAESPMGAQGLMQVMSKVHHDKFQDMGGVQAALNPVANIRVGALILKDYVTRGGSVEAGLKSYVGAAAFETDSGYGSRVLAEYHKLKLVAAGKNIPIFNPAPPPSVVPAEPQAAVVQKEAPKAESEQLAGL